MTPCTFFFDRHFQFYDGEEGRKILLTVGTAHGITLVVKTTSQGRRYRNDFGCQANHRFPNFYLVRGCCCLSKSTWVALDEFYEIRDAELLQKHYSGDVNRIGTLPDQLAIDLMKCALQSDDISPRQAGIARGALDAFYTPSQEK